WAPAQAGEQRQAFAHQAAAAFDLERQHRAQRRCGCAAVQLLLRAAETREVLAGQVDAPAAEVLGDVLAVLGDLERRADAVGERDQLLLALSEDAEHDLADRVGRQRAVGPQLLPRLV